MLNRIREQQAKAEQERLRLLEEEAREKGLSLHPGGVGVSSSKSEQFYRLKDIERIRAKTLKEWIKRNLDSDDKKQVIDAGANTIISEKTAIFLYTNEKKNFKQECWLLIEDRAKDYGYDSAYTMVFDAVKGLAEQKTGTRFTFN